MKTIFILLVAVILITSCSKESNGPQYNISCDFMNDTIIRDYGSILSESQDSFYYEIWKTELLELNGLDDLYFNQHFQNIHVSSLEWDGGITFNVDYLFVFEWLKFKVSDSFMVKLKSSWSVFNHLPIPRDTLLNDYWTKYNIRNEIYYNGTCKIKKIESLEFNSCEEACQKFKELSGYSMIHPERISLYVPGKSPRIDGYPYFIGYGLIDSALNKCVDGYFNLLNKEYDVREVYCGPIP